LSACATAAPATLATARHASDTVEDSLEKLLKVKRIEDSAPETYRILWHPWHQNSAAIGITMRDGWRILEVSQTDGYGTYTVGDFKSVVRTSISREEFEAIASPFQALSGLTPQSFGELVSWPDGQDRICLHSSSYTLESRVGGAAHSLWRWCHPDYSRDFEIAKPLLSLAWKKFPEQMKNIDPSYADGRTPG
jgi:hypothetical protein